MYIRAVLGHGEASSEGKFESGTLGETRGKSKHHMPYSGQWWNMSTGQGLDSEVLADSATYAIAHATTPTMYRRRRLRYM